MGRGERGKALPSGSLAGELLPHSPAGAGAPSPSGFKALSVWGSVPLE